MKKLLIIITILFLGSHLNAQVKIGDNPTNLNQNAALEIESTSKGLLLPRMTKAQMNAIQNPTSGLVVFVTDVNCSFVYNGSVWKNTCAANINASFDSGSLSCAGALAGDYVATVAMTSTNTKIANITVVTPGDYIASTNEANGVKFEGEGTLNSTGVNTQIVLQAKGKPNSSGSYTYTLFLGGQTCTFTINYANPPALLKNDIVDCFSSSAASGTYMPQVVMTSSNTKMVKVTPKTIGYCILSTPVVNGISYKVSTVFTSSDTGVLKSLTMTAVGTPITPGTFTYTVGGTGVNSTCTFTVDFACPKVLTGFMQDSLANDTPSLGSHRFTLTAPAPGKFILFGSANMFLSSAFTGYYGMTYSIKANGTVLMDASLPNTCPGDAWQNIPFSTEFSVSSSGSYNVDFILAFASGLKDFKLQYIYVPNYSACVTSSSITSGNIDVNSAFNNSPSAGSHRFTISAPSAGKFVLVAKANIYSSSSSIMSILLSNGSNVIGNAVLAGDHYSNSYQMATIYTQFAVTQAGSYNFDLSTFAVTGATNPSLEWVFIPSTLTNFEAGHLESTYPNNTPSTQNHRFTLTAPAAGKFVIIGSANVWNSNLNGKGFVVKNNSTVLETCTAHYYSPMNNFTIVPFSTELAVSSSGTYDIDIVPFNVNSSGGLAYIYLQYIFVPN